MESAGLLNFIPPPYRQKKPALVRFHGEAWRVLLPLILRKFREKPRAAITSLQVIEPVELRFQWNMRTPSLPNTGGPSSPHPP